VALAALLALTAAFFWRLVFTPLILPRGDVFTYFYPLWAYRNTVMQTGHLPLWNAYLFMGAPFLANSQAGVLYPLNWPLIGLEAPDAVKAALVMHTALAAAGMYLFSRRRLGVSELAGLIAAAVFAFGGYYGAQAEHVNQAQGLAWLPWLFWLYSEATTGHPKAFLGLGAAFAAQLLAGHTQSAFISGVGLGLWALWETVIRWKKHRQRQQRRNLWQLTAPWAGLAAAAALAVMLAAAQVFPTWELARLSNRGGGLPALEAVSFSLHPALLGRALLPPAGGDMLFSEYVAYSGVAGLMLAVTGLLHRRKEAAVIGLAILTAAGLFLALGAYNPVYWLLVRFAPGFDLFRAPARWLVLAAFGVAALAGTGLDAVLLSSPDQQRSNRASSVPLIATIVLIALAFLAPLAGDAQGATSPDFMTVAQWAAAALLAALALNLRFSWQAQQYAPMLLAIIATLELFGASRSLPYNDLSAPQAWTSQRPAISTLLAAQTGSTAPARILSLSDIAFDPGDLRELEAIYGPWLDEQGLYDLIIATKQKEILAPNLPLAWQIPSMDGFDGGILPTRAYTQFTSLFLPPDTTAADGRLREYLDSVPDLAWLRMANVGWIITDKVGDAWIDGVYYDLQFSTGLSVHDSPVSPPPVIGSPQLPFTATAVGMVGYLEGSGGVPDGTQIGSIALYVPGEEFPLVQPLLVGRDFVEGAAEDRQLAIVAWSEPFRAEWVEVSLVASFPGRFVLQGMTLIDQRSGAFVPLTISADGVLHSIYSAEVKIYEYRGALPRAYLVCQPDRVNSQEEALAHLAGDPGRAVIESGEPPGISGCDPASPGTAIITTYEPESITVEVSADGSGSFLILSDSWYPGWQAEVDGQPAPVLRANALFRAVAVPQGSHTVTMEYKSRPLMLGAAVSLLSLTGVIAAALIRWPRSSHSWS
jgi:hypothetical protein